MNTSNESSTSVYSDADIVHITSSTISLIPGVPINSWVLWLVLTGPAGTMASDFFTLNLSVCEILFSLLCLPTVITRIELFAAFATAFVVTGRPVFQCCICVERFLAVVHPVLFLKYKPLRYRVACSALAWVLIIGITLLYGLLFMFVIMKVYFYYLGQCLFFMSVMLLCSLAVLRALKQPMPGETGRERERDNSMKRRAFTIICTIMGSFLGSYFIWCIALICFIQGLFLHVAYLLTTIFIFLTVVAGFVHPLLYLCQKTGKLTCGGARWHSG